MPAPTTHLDARYSGPDAVAAGWDATLGVLEAAELFWLSTVRADGRPHVTPLVAVWFDGALHFCTGAGEQKERNLRVNPRVVLTTGCNDWDGGLDVVVEGEAVRCTDEEVLGRLADVWATKWDGRWQWVIGGGAFRHEDGEAALVYSVAPTQVLAFAKGAFAHTRHRFGG